MRKLWNYKWFFLLQFKTPFYVGDIISVFRPLENQYFPGTVDYVNLNGQHVIKYDDEDVETLTLANEDWWFEHSSTFHASKMWFITTLESNEWEIPSEMFEGLGNHSSLRYQTQTFGQAPLIKAYKEEEQKFSINVKSVPRSSVPKSANMIGSHTITR